MPNALPMEVLRTIPPRELIHVSNTSLAVMNNVVCGDEPRSEPSVDPVWARDRFAQLRRTQATTTSRPSQPTRRRPH